MDDVELIKRLRSYGEDLDWQIEDCLKAAASRLESLATELRLKNAIGERFRDFLKVPRDEPKPCALCGVGPMHAIHDWHYGGTHSFMHPDERGASDKHE